MRGVALLAGLFVVPGLLLWLGHHLRDRSVRQRGAFWGGVIAHTLAMVLTLLLAMSPPVWWQGGSALRDLAVHWTLLLGGLAGVLVGGAIGKAPAPQRRASPGRRVEDQRAAG